MKSSRQALILELIREEDIETQQELAQALCARGVRVTQATVSRDIKEMRLFKVQTAEGKHKYASSGREEPTAGDRMIRLLTETLLSVEAADNMIVMKTLSGTANAACEALDNMDWPEVLGTLAGDNTIFMVVRSDELAPQVVERIRSLIR